MTAPQTPSLIDYAGFRDGQCITIAYKSRSAKQNAATIGEMLAAGCQEVREMPTHDACEAHRAYLRTLPGASA